MKPGLNVGTLTLVAVSLASVYLLGPVASSHVYLSLCLIFLGETKMDTLEMVKSGDNWADVEEGCAKEVEIAELVEGLDM